MVNTRILGQAVEVNKETVDGFAVYTISGNDLERIHARCQEYNLHPSLIKHGSFVLDEFNYEKPIGPAEEFLKALTAGASHAFGGRSP